MSNLSGYDSEVVGFNSISRNKRSETNSSTQTTEFSEGGSSTQTNLSREKGCNVRSEDFKCNVDTNPPGLNEFLRRVVPGVLEQLDQNDRDILYNSSDSDEEEAITAKLFQDIPMKVNSGAGDNQNCILSVSFSSAGNTIAVSIGHRQHENWCDHDGLIKIYTVKRTFGDKFVHAININEKNCVTVVQYHPSVAALLAYATTSGEVVIYNLRDNVEGQQLTSPSGCHGSKRVSSLKWADAALTNTFLTIQINNTGKRRSASDQVLLSSGCDGTLNIWQVNSNLKIFESITTYSINGSRKLPAPYITCFDFIKSHPLQTYDEKVADDVFVVGTTCGRLFLCTIKGKQIVDSDYIDPVYEMLEGHSTCVLNVAFSFQKPGVFASVSMDSELRVYDVNQAGPLKVLCLDKPISCMAWLPNNSSVVILGQSCDTRDKSQQLIVYNVSSGRAVPVEGFTGGATVTALSVNQSGSCRIAAGDSDSVLRVWELPARRIKLSPEDLHF